jgi:hypothetical protein
MPPDPHTHTQYGVSGYNTALAPARIRALKRVCAHRPHLLLEGLAALLNKTVLQGGLNELFLERLYVVLRTRQPQL